MAPKRMMKAILVKKAAAGWPDMVAEIDKQRDTPKHRARNGEEGISEAESQKPSTPYLELVGKNPPPTHNQTLEQPITEGHRTAVPRNIGEEGRCGNCGNNLLPGQQQTENSSASPRHAYDSFGPGEESSTAAARPTDDNSIDSDMLSIPDTSSSTAEVWGSQSLPRVALEATAQRLLSGFRDEHGYRKMSPARDETGSSSSGASTGASQTSSKRAGTASKMLMCRKSRSRPENTSEGEEENDEFLRPPPQKKSKMERHEGTGRPRYLACPFLKLDPVRYESCCANKMKRIRDVKQHLSRRHTPDYYCQRCLKTDFRNEESLQVHVDLGDCVLRHPRLLEGVSYAQRGRLTRKSNSNLTEEEQWFAVWDIVFPGRMRPSSAYLDSDLSMGMALFREYCYVRGPAILREQIELDPEVLVLDGRQHLEGESSVSSTGEERTRYYLETVISQGIRSLFNDWQQRRASLVSPSYDPPPQPANTQIGAPPSTFPSRDETESTGGDRRPSIDRDRRELPYCRDGMTAGIVSSSTDSSGVLDYAQDSTLTGRAEDGLPESGWEFLDQAVEDLARMDSFPAIPGLAAEGDTSQYDETGILFDERDPLQSDMGVFKW